jgi:hypothetical protein
MKRSILKAMMSLDDELSGNNELSRNNNLSKCLVDDFHYITPQDQDTYFFINDGDDV